MDRPKEKGPKKPYTPPTLTIYGSVQALTQLEGRLGNPDNILNLPPKTGF